MTRGVPCPACGRPLEPGAAFCATCGTPVAAWARQPQAPAPPSGPHPALVAGLVVACLLALSATAAVVVVATGSGGDEPAVAAPAAATAAPATVVREVDAPSPKRSGTTYDRGAYRLTLPDGWTVRERGVDHGAYVESVWRSPDDPDVTVLVDHTPGYTDSPETGARSVRSATSRSAGYRELGFGPTTLDGRSAWRWEFELGGVRKTDWFLTACGTGYALLGAAPTASFEEHADTFRDAAASLTPTCS